MASTSVRLPDDLLQNLDDLAAREHTDRSVVLRRALERGVHDLRLDKAVRSYLDGTGSLGWCAHDAGVVVVELMDELRRRGLGVRTDEDHLREQVGAGG